MVNVFFQATIHFNGFSMVLIPLDHHHWMFLEGPTIGFDGFQWLLTIGPTMKWLRWCQITGLRGTAFTIQAIRWSILQSEYIEMAKCILRDVLKKWNELRCDCSGWMSAEINYPKFPTPLNPHLFHPVFLFHKNYPKKKKIRKKLPKHIWITKNPPTLIYFTSPSFLGRRKMKSSICSKLREAHVNQIV